MTTSNTMNLYFVMHHGSPREMFANFMGPVDTLFGGREFNPYRTDAVGNTHSVLSRQSHGRGPTRGCAGESGARGAISDLSDREIFFA